MFQVMTQIHTAGNELQQGEPPVAQQQQDAVEDDRHRACRVHERGEPAPPASQILERRSTCAGSVLRTAAVAARAPATATADARRAGRRHADRTYCGRFEGSQLRSRHSRRLRVGIGRFASRLLPRFSFFRHSAQTGAKTAQTIESVIADQDVGEQSDDDAERAERLRVLVQRRARSRAARWRSCRRGRRSRESRRAGANESRPCDGAGSAGSRARRRSSRRSRPEARTSQPLGSSSDAEPNMTRDDAAEDEEPDREEQLVGRCPHGCARRARTRPGTAARRESPDQEADHDRDRGRRDVVRGRAEQVARRCSRSRRRASCARSARCANAFSSPSGQVEDAR